MGKPLVRFCEGLECNFGMDEILWHRRETRRQTEKTNLDLNSRDPIYSPLCYVGGLIIACCCSATVACAKAELCYHFQRRRA